MERMTLKQFREAGGFAATAPRRRTRRRNTLFCKDGDPSEEKEQRDFALYMDELKKLYEVKGLRLVWNHNPHGGKRPKGEAGKLAAFGASKGVPDNYIYTPAPNHPQARGVAIELKRAKKGKASEDQLKWAEDLDACGWITAICHGAHRAIEFVRELGYENPLKNTHLEDSLPSTTKENKQ